MGVGGKSFETKSLSMKKVALTFLLVDAIGVYAVQSHLSTGVPADMSVPDEFASTELARPVSETARAAVPYIGLPPSMAVTRQGSAPSEPSLVFADIAPAPVARRAPPSFLRDIQRPADVETLARPSAPPAFLRGFQRPTDSETAAKSFESALDLPNLVEASAETGANEPSSAEHSAALGDIAINSAVVPASSVAAEAATPAAPLPSEVSAPVELPALDSGSPTDAVPAAAEAKSLPAAAFPAG